MEIANMAVDLSKYLSYKEKSMAAKSYISQKKRKMLSNIHLLT